MHAYHKGAVEAAIRSHSRIGHKISKREASLIHALLKGHEKPEAKDIQQ